MFSAIVSYSQYITEYPEVPGIHDSASPTGRSLFRVLAHPAQGLSSPPWNGKTNPQHTLSF